MGILNCKRERDLQYSLESDTCMLDIYHPRTGSGYSVIIFVHGGGWTLGSKDTIPYPANAREFCDRDYVCVVPNYRLTEEAVWPACSEDIVAVLEYVVENVSDYGGDPDKIFIGGHSAGAHIAAYNLLTLYNEDPLPDILDSIKGCYLVSGIYHLSECSEWTIENRIIPQFGEDTEVWDEVSPIFMLPDDAMCPFLIIYADEDTDELIYQALEFYEAVDDIPDQNVTLVRIRCEGHLSEVIPGLRTAAPFLPYVDNFVTDLS